jgi:DnaJ-class molecular chaperone
MSLYKFLDVDMNATLRDIKKAYRKKALQYHPDKTLDNDSDNFIRIKNAYKVLSDETKRRKYDDFLLSEDKDSINSVIGNATPYSMLRKIMSKYYICELFNLMDMVYDRSKFENDFNNFNFYKIYKNLKLNISHDIKSLDITKTVNFTFKELYNNTEKKVEINKFIDDRYETIVKIICPDPYYEELVWEKEGDSFDDKSGNLIIKINIEDDLMYEICDEYNLLYSVYVDKLLLPNDKKVIIMEGMEIINEHYVLKENGLLNTSTNKRGDLFMKINNNATESEISTQEC